MLLLRCFREVDPMTCCARQTLEVYTRAWPPSWTRHPQLSSARKHPVCLRRRYYKSLSLSLSLSLMLPIVYRTLLLRCYRLRS